MLNKNVQAENSPVLKPWLKPQINKVVLKGGDSIKNNENKNFRPAS